MAHDLVAELQARIVALEAQRPTPRPVEAEAERIRAEVATAIGRIYGPPRVIDPLAGATLVRGRTSGYRTLTIALPLWRG